MSSKFKDLIFYEIYPTSFYDSNGDGIGDLNGINEKLDYVKELGCNAIWLNPFYSSPFKDGGYDVKDFFKVDEKFGTNEDFKNLATKAHKLGIKVIVDLVIGHSSEENEEFLKSASPYKNENSDLFIWTDSVWAFEPNIRLLNGRFPRDGAYMVNFFAMQPAFNYGFNKITNPKWQMSYKDERTFKARNYMLKVMKFWLDLGCDGFRVDMADYLVKNDDTKEGTIEVWKYLFSKIRKDYPDAYFVSEWSSPDKALFAGFDADFVLDHNNNFINLLGRNQEKMIVKGNSREQFIKDLLWRQENANKYNGVLAPISGNHDSRRVATSLNEKELQLVYMILLSLPGNPFIYYGDEIGMVQSELISKDGGYQRTGARTPMQWDDSPNAGFSSTESELYLPVFKGNKNNLKDEMNDPSSIYHFIKKLIRIRKENDDLRSSYLDVKDKNDILTIIRGQTKLIINFSKKDLSLEGKEIIFTNSKGNILKPFEAALIK